MRPPLTKVLQTFALLIGAMALVFSSTGVAGATEGDNVPVTENGELDAGNTPDAVAGESAQPSGKDRLVEPGGSGEQGKSPADPDGDFNGGPDKPDEAGGVFQGDQDGNNGCGNDQDFEDDNNGNCGGPADAPGKDKPDTPVDEDGEDNGNGGETPEVGNGNEGNGADKVTICHATGSETNPYEIITISKNAVINSGHGDHADDIIPAFDGFDGVNTDMVGSGCESTPGTGGETPGTGGETPGTGGETPGTGGEIPVVGGEVEVPVVEGEAPVVPVAEVEGNEVVRPVPAVPAIPNVAPAIPAQPVVFAAAERSPQVLGTQVTRAPGQLARTGSNTTNLVLFGLGSVLLGLGVQRSSTRFAAARVR